MSTSQAEFSTALLNPDQPVPDGLIDPSGRPAGRRYNVYRNNVVVSLKDALQTAFPAVSSVVGEEFFNAMAGNFLREHPPKSPLLYKYGEDFPVFLEGFEPVAKVPYLPDLARLEIALRQSYHSADKAPLKPEEVSSLATCDPKATYLSLAPSTRLVRSPWPIVDIWSHAISGTDMPAVPTAQNTLVLRKDFDPVPFPVSEPEAAFIKHVLNGDTLAQALDASPDVPFEKLLTLLIQQNALCEIKMD